MESDVVRTGFLERKCLNYRGFLEKRDAQDLQDFVQRMFHVEFLANNGHQHIDANRNPNLRLHRVRRSPIKRLNSQMLLDPPKEQLDLPPTFVKMRNCQCWQVEVVGQEHEPLARLGVAVDHATQGFGVEFRRLRAAENDRLVAAQSRRLLDPATGATCEVEAALGSRHEECQTRREPMKTSEIDVSSIHDVERAGFDRQMVEDGDIGGFPLGNPHETGDVAPQVQECVQLHRTLAATEFRPGEKRQAEVDGRGIQCVGGLLELSAEAIGLVQPPRPGDQDLSEVGVDAPVAVFVGIGERAPSDDAAKARVLKFLVKGMEADFDVSQALAIGQLSEGHAEELIETGEVVNLSIAVIASDATVELVFGQRVDQLGEDVAIVEHEPAPAALRRVGNGSRLLWNSDRRQQI